MRLIDADALIAEVMFGSVIPHKSVETVIKRQPTIEPKRGKWIEDKYTRICSVCGSTYWRRGGDEWNYCPNCGAKMDGGEG